MIELAASFDTQFASIAPFFLYLLIGVIIFVETGILLGFFLPGDSILFSAGLVAASHPDINIAVLTTIVFIAAFFGDQIGFVLGRLVGRPYLERHNSPRIQSMITRSERFYEQTGWWAVVAARFFPWIRTFVPPIAGAAKMNYYKFLSANVLGALLWGVGITVSGYFSGSIPWLKNITYSIAVFFIVASIISGVINYRRENRD